MASNHVEASSRYKEVPSSVVLQYGTVAGRSESHGEYARETCRREGRQFPSRD